MSKIEEDFIRNFPKFDWNFTLDFQLLINKIENKVFDLVNSDHACSIWIILFPVIFECFECFVSDLLLFVEQFSFEAF